MTGEATSPEDGKLTSGGDDLTPSPGSDTSTSGGTEGTDLEKQNTELRRKITEQAEALKLANTRMQQFNNELAELKKSSQQGPEEDGLDDLLEAFYSDEGSTKENFKKILEAVQDRAYNRALNEVKSSVDPAIERVNKNTVQLKVQTFFNEQGAPELAANGSNFWTFTQNLMAQEPWLSHMFNSNMDEALLYTYGKYTSVFGEPESVRRKARATEKKLNASMSEPSSATTDLTPELQDFFKKGPEDESLYEAYTRAEKAGLFDRR